MRGDPLGFGHDSRTMLRRRLPATCVLGAVLVLPACSSLGDDPAGAVPGLPDLQLTTAEHWQHIRSTNPIESTFATAPGGPKDAARAQPPSPWSSNWPTRPSEGGAN